MENQTNNKLAKQQTRKYLPPWMIMDRNVDIMLLDLRLESDDGDRDDDEDSGDKDEPWIMDRVLITSSG